MFRVITLLLIVTSAYGQILLNDNKFADGWKQIAGARYSPAGTVEKKENSLALISGTAPINMYTAKAYDVQQGDCLAFQLGFQGKGVALVGFYGYDASGKSTNENPQRTFRVLSDNVDRRKIIIEVTKPATSKIRLVFGAGPESKIDILDFNVEKLPRELTELYSVNRNRAEWRKRIEGVNLAAGLPVTFDPKPYYSLTSKDDTDTTDLTDGKLGRNDDNLWFGADAVAWTRAYNGITIIIDLQKVQPVRRAVIRINGGKSDVNFPQQLEAWVSKDGENYFRTCNLNKLPSLESQLSNWQDLYYLPEDGAAYVYPFELPINADARFVAIRAPIYSPISMVTDELAVIRAEKEETSQEGYNSVYLARPRPLVHQTVILRPRMDHFYVADNLTLPNRLILDDRRQDKNGKFTYIIDLPAEVSRIADNSWPAQLRTPGAVETAGSRVRYHYEPTATPAEFGALAKRYRNVVGPFFFRATSANIPADQQYAVFTTVVDGKEAYSERLPLSILSVPEVSRLTSLNIVSPQIMPGHALAWPDFFRVQRHLGFNGVPFFCEAAKDDRMYQEALEAGFRVMLVMSPTAMMNNKYPDVTEYRCFGSVKGLSACPAYRGKYYQEILENITAGIKKYPAVFNVTFDEESWETSQLAQMMNCSRCNSLREKQNMSWVQYLEWVQADYLKQYKSAIAAGCGGNKLPEIGFYAAAPGFGYTSPVGKIPFLGGKKLFPETADQWQPSYYGRSSAGVQKLIRPIFCEYSEPARILTWLTGGAGAYNETAYPERTGQHLLEALMNGSGGIIYYRYESFESPLDFYSHAKALAAIAPHEAILAKGKLVEIRGSNPKLLYTARKLGNQTLLLIGNYENRQAAETSLKHVASASVIDLSTGKVAGRTLTVASDSYGLYLLSEQ